MGSCFKFSDRGVSHCWAVVLICSPVHHVLRNRKDVQAGMYAALIGVCLDER